MKRLHQIVFVVAALALSWLLMMLVHESGHILGALSTGGIVRHVQLDPLSISRTDVAPNPHPGIVVWLGPVFGCLLPLIGMLSVPRGRSIWRKLAQFFTGFCLIANGAYIAGGALDGIGDCGEMLRSGTPRWVMFAFGGVTIPLGLFLWHELGSLREFTRQPPTVSPSLAYGTLVALLLVLAVEFAAPYLLG